MNVETNVPERRLPTLIRAAVIVALGFAVYVPVIHGDWLHDDAVFVASNFGVRTRSLGRMFMLWLDPDVVDYFPLTYTAFWIQYAFFGLSTTGYHATTLLLHITNGLLLWGLLAKLRIPGAWFAALVFTIHPACVESVAWISELKNTLSLAPFLASCIFWVMQDDAAEGPRQKWLYAGSFFFFLLSLLAKPTAIAMPVVTLLYAWWKRGRVVGRDVVHAVPFFLLSIILGVVTIQFQHGRALGMEKLPLGGIDSRIALAGMAILFYLATIVWPINLLPVYPAWQIDPPRLWQFLPWIVIVSAAWWIWSNRHSWGRHAIFALGFFLLMIAPVLGFVGLAWMRLTWVADHFLYVPMIGPLALLVAAASTWMAAGDALRWRTGKVVGAAVTVFLAGTTLLYAGQWVNERCLWEYTVARNNNAWVAHDRLGAMKLRHDDIEGALNHFRQASKLRPDLGETKKKLGEALLRQGNYDEAVSVLEESVAASPWLFESRACLAEAYCKVGRIEESLKLTQELLKDDPTNCGVLTTYAAAISESGDKEKAIEQLEWALTLNPEYEPARKELERLRTLP